MVFNLDESQRNKALEFYRNSPGYDSKKEQEIISLVAQKLEQEISEKGLISTMEEGLTKILKSVIIPSEEPKKENGEKLRPYFDKFLQERNIKVEYSQIPKTIVMVSAKCYEEDGKFSEEKFYKEVEGWFESRKTPTDTNKSDLAKRLQKVLNESKIEYTPEDIKELVELSTSCWVPIFGYNILSLKKVTKDYFVSKEKRVVTAQIKMEEQFPQLPTPQQSELKQNLENLVEEQPLVEVIETLPDESKESVPTPSEAFGNNVDAHKSYKPMEEIGNFIEDIINRVVIGTNREEVLEYLKRMAEDIATTPKYYAHLEGSRKYFDPIRISSLTEDCINNYTVCKEKGIELASSTKELIEKEKMQDVIIKGYEEMGIVPNEERMKILVGRVEEAAEVMNLKNTISIPIIKRIIKHEMEEDLEKKLEEQKKDKKESDNKSEIVKKETTILPPGGIGYVPSEEHDFKEELRKPPESKDVVRKKNETSRLLIGTTIGSFFTGVTALIFSVIAYNNSKINTNYDEVCKRIERTVAQTVDTQIETKLDKYTPKSLQETIYRSQTESLVKFRHELEKQQKEINDITKEFSKKIDSLEKRKDLTSDFEKLSEDQKKLQQDKKSLEQYVNDISKKISSLETPDNSTRQDIAKLKEEYQKQVSDLSEILEDLKKEFESKGTLVQERIQELKDEFKEYLTDLESSLEKYILSHKEEHKPKEVIKPKKEPGILLPIPNPKIPENILEELEELKRRK